MVTRHQQANFPIHHHDQEQSTKSAMLVHFADHNIYNRNFQKYNKTSYWLRSNPMLISLSRGRRMCDDHTDSFIQTPGHQWERYVQQQQRKVKKEKPILLTNASKVKNEPITEQSKRNVVNSTNLCVHVHKMMQVVVTSFKIFDSKSLKNLHQKFCNPLKI